MKAIEIVETSLAEADDGTKKSLEETFVKASKAMKVKVIRDVDTMQWIERDDNFVLPMTNRSNVSK